MTPDEVKRRLCQAGETLLSLPGAEHHRRLTERDLDYVADPAQQFAEEHGRFHASRFTASHIASMEEAFGWITLIPRDRYVLRRIVGARCLVSPVNGKHLFTWPKLAGLLGADREAVARWHGMGIELICAALAEAERRKAA